MIHRLDFYFKYSVALHIVEVEPAADRRPSSGVWTKAVSELALVVRIRSATRRRKEVRVVQYWVTGWS